MGSVDSCIIAGKTKMESSTHPAAFSEEPKKETQLACLSLDIMEDFERLRSLHQELVECKAKEELNNKKVAVRNKILDGHPTPNQADTIRKQMFQIESDASRTVAISMEVKHI